MIAAFYFEEWSLHPGWPHWPLSKPTSDSAWQCLSAAPEASSGDNPCGGMVRQPKATIQWTVVAGYWIVLGFQSFVPSKASARVLQLRFLSAYFSFLWKLEAAWACWQQQSKCVHLIRIVLWVIRCAQDFLFCLLWTCRDSRSFCVKLLRHHESSWGCVGVRGGHPVTIVMSTKFLNFRGEVESTRSNYLY